MTSKPLLFISVVLIIVVPVATVGAQTVDSNDGYESNDSIGTATEISPGTYSDLQLVSDENDYYALSVEAGEPLNITAKFPYERAALIPDNDPELTLVDADGNELDDSLLDRPANGYPVRRIHYESNTSQTVYIRMYGTEDEDATTEYELIVEQSENDEYEPNGVLADATAIEPGTHDGTLLSDEHDFYSLSVEDGDTLNITTTYLGHSEYIPDNDPELTLVDSDGNELDDSLLDRPADGNAFRRLQYEATANRTVYVLVEGTDDEEASVDYELIVEQSENDEYEPNGVLADATAIEPGTHDGTLLSNEHDFYSLSVEDGDTLNITTTYLGHSEYIPDNDPELTLVDNDGNELTDSLQTNPADGDAFRRLQYEATASRTVYVLVEGTNDEEASVDYNLTVERAQTDGDESNGGGNTVPTTTPSGELITEPAEPEASEESVTTTGARDTDETDVEDGATENTVGGSGPGFTAAIAVVTLLLAVAVRLQVSE